MKEKLKRSIILINLLIAVCIYLPILVPFSVYMASGSFMFQVSILHLIILTAVFYSVSAIEE